MTHSFPTRRSSDLRNPDPRRGRQRHRQTRRLQPQTPPPPDRRPPLPHGIHKPMTKEFTLEELRVDGEIPARSEEHTSELQSLMRISYAVFCLTKKKNKSTNYNAPMNEQVTR